MKLSQSRDPRPLPDFAASFLQPHLFNFTSALSLRALLVSSLLYLYLHLLSISASMAGKQGSLSLLTTSTACTPVWRHTANLCESNRMSFCSPLLSL